MPFLGAPFTDMGAPDPEHHLGVAAARLRAAPSISAGISDGLSTTCSSRRFWWQQAAIDAASRGGDMRRNSPGSNRPTRRVPTCCNPRNTAVSVPPNPRAPARPAGSTGDLYVGLGLVNVPRSMHAGGVEVGMADGSVRLIKNSVNIFVFQALSSTTGNEILGGDSY